MQLIMAGLDLIDLFSGVPYEFKVSNQTEEVVIEKHPYNSHYDLF